MLITGIKPVGSDDCEEYVALGHLITQDLDEACPEWNGVNVHEQEITAQDAVQAIVDAPGRACAVITAITDEDSRGPPAPHSKERPVGASRRERLNYVDYLNILQTRPKHHEIK